MPDTTCEAAAQAFKQGSTCCVCRELSLEELLCYPVSSVIGGGSSLQLSSSEGLKGHG